MEQSDLKVGDKVCYSPEHVGGRKENERMLEKK